MDDIFVDAGLGEPEPLDLNETQGWYIDRNVRSRVAEDEMPKNEDATLVGGVNTVRTFHPTHEKLALLTRYRDRRAELKGA